MSKKQFTEEFRQEAIRQIVDRGRPVAEVSAALGVSTHSLYAWLKEFKKPGEVSAAEEEVKRLQAELRKVTEERDILKNVRCQALSAAVQLRKRPYGAMS